MQAEKSCIIQSRSRTDSLSHSVDLVTSFYTLRMEGKEGMYGCSHHGEE